MSMFADHIQTGHAHHPQPHSSSHQGYVGHQVPYAPSHNAEVHASALCKPRFQIFGVKYVEFALLLIQSYLQMDGAGDYSEFYFIFGVLMTEDSYIGE